MKIPAGSVLVYSTNGIFIFGLPEGKRLVLQNNFSVCQKAKENSAHKKPASKEAGRGKKRASGAFSRPFP